MRLRLSHLLVVVVVLAAACGGDDAPTPDLLTLPPPDAGLDAPAAPDIRELLEAIPGLTIVDEMPVNGARFFHLIFEQPADHANPSGPTFGQRLTLLHRSTDAPTVLALSGYYVWNDPYEEEPTAILSANQLAVEHRFFEPSRPEPADWSLLTIRQSADDHHALVQAFRTIYPGAWISTGASKGGMTAIYHRRFYPDDVDGTVAYVAPISFGAPDDRYPPFWDTVGDAACRAAVDTFQRELLLRRTAMRLRMDDQAATGGWTYDRFGPDVAFESAVIEFEFAFWQYWGIDSCIDIPGPADSDDQLWGILDGFVSVTQFSDAITEYYEPYYYQAADELGYPDVPVDHLADLLLYQSVDTIAFVIPVGSTPSYDPAVMQDISNWVTTQGDRLLFVYGQWDPWTAGAFDLGAATDSYKLVAPRGTHASGIYSLTGSDFTTALDAVHRWAADPSGKPRLSRAPLGLPRPPHVLPHLR